MLLFLFRLSGQQPQEHLRGLDPVVRGAALLGGAPQTGRKTPRSTRLRGRLEELIVQHSHGFSTPREVIISNLIMTILGAPMG